MPESQPPSPALFFETVNAFQRTAAIKAAIELECFTAIAEGNQTPAALARRCEAHERGMRMLCDYLTVIGLLLKENGRYRLTPDSAHFLDRRSPAYLGGTIEFILAPAHVEAFDDLVASVRRGGTALSDDGSIKAEHPMWVTFARAMPPLMRMPAELIAERFAGEPRQLKVLDVAAGHGLFGIAIARHNPQAQVVALDWPQVLEVARENAREAGVAQRYDVIEGSAFEADYGDGYDLVLLTNFLHHFDAAACERLLRKVHRSLAPNGKVLTLEFVPDEGRVSPPVPAAFAITMLSTTPAGDVYTFPEYERMFGNAGFSMSELHALPPTMQCVIVSVR